VSRSSLGKLVAVHAVSPVHQQRAAVVTGLSFLFFLAMMFLVYIRGNFGYFLLSTAFLVVFIFTAIGWWMQRRNAVEVFDQGLAFRKLIATWGEITHISRTPDGALKLTIIGKSSTTIPKTLDALDRLEAHIRSRVGHPRS
jgi:hypothetical protein